MKKLILVGQAPSQASDPTAPLMGEPLASKLAHLCGWTLDRYAEQTFRINVIKYWPGKNGKGDAFPLDEAKQRAAKMVPLFRGRKVVFLGRMTAAAFDLGGPFLQWTKANGFEYAILPHPSGINRWYNDDQNCWRALRFMRRAACAE